ncbi:unnamed protein product [Adineta steineri]|uniref:Uncharacterized protein n=1 Tax=Adineta steineri TaxID=433720 RepID=A0A819DSA1_9BILA|nr:unnamed protein product [Adineta steineri]CAF3838056.1 unnamed protein product [Adineta steineri]
MADSDYSSDSDDTSRRIYFTQYYQSKCSIGRTPRASVRELNKCAARILDNISKVNNRHADQEKSYDCVAVALTTDGELIVSGNVKQRFLHPTTGTKKIRIEYGEIGFSERLIDSINQALGENLNKYGEFKVRIIEQNHNEAPTAVDNARGHAEVKILADAQQRGKKILKIGVSKATCTKCTDKLKSQDIAFKNDKDGNNKPKNWAEPDEVTVQQLKTIKRRRVRVKGDLNRTNIPETSREARNIIKNNVKQQIVPKPTCSITAASILDIIEDIDKDPCAQANTFKVYAGKYEKPRTRRVGYCASATIAEASASASIFGASASVCSASAHVEGGVNLSAGANVSVARAEAHAGPVQVGVGLNFNTGVSVGLDGLHASFLGMGIDIGPRLSIQTPFADVSCTIS